MKYEEPKMEVVLFEEEDIIRTSTFGGGAVETEEDPLFNDH